MAAPTNTKKDKQKIMDQANMAALKAEEMSRAGGIPMDGRSLTGAPESTIGMSRNDRFFSQGRAADEQQREGYKTFGDKATGEGINKLRALQGRPPISNTPKEFTENINKSVGFGGESALLDQAGRDRALKSGIGAGLSPQEADAEVSKAYDFLKKKYGDKTTPTTPTTLDGSGNETSTPTSSPTSSPTAPPTPTLPPVVPVEKGPIMNAVADAMTGGTGERFLVKGGSMFLREKARLEKVAAEAAAKAAGATGDAVKPAGAVGDVAKVVGKAGGVGARMRDTQAGTGAAPKLVGKADGVGARMRQTQAGAADEAAGAAGEAAAAAGKGGGLFSKLSEGLAKSQLGRGALATGRIAGKGARLFGRAAGPALDIYDAGRFFVGGDEVKDEYEASVGTMGERLTQPKSVGEFAGAVGDVLSPVKNVLGTSRAISNLLKSQRGVRESDASLTNMENIYKAIDDRRRELYPDEVFDDLPLEQRRKIKQSIRKEFLDAGAKF